jgi:stage IV sporulation protein FB
MAWQDRPYYRDSDSSGGRSNPLSWLLSGSIPLFTVFGIRVRAHASMVIFVALIVLLGLGPGSTVASRIQASTMLFAIVLLHEFGHCFAARSVGGAADDIMMTPIGGLAFAMAPKRPWPTFVTVAGGPLVNVIICLLCGAGLYFTIGVFPLGPFSFGEAYRDVVGGGIAQVAGYLFWAYSVSYALLLFNLLPVWPLDGGQLLQSILWRPAGYYKSMLWTVTIGIGGGALMILAGIASFGAIFGGLLLALIGLHCLMNCIQMRRMLLAEGPWGFVEEDESIDYSASLRPEKRRKPSWLARQRVRRLKRLEREEAAERERVDAILDKVAHHGMQSLNWRERRALHKATEHQRQRDAELRRVGR